MAINASQVKELRDKTGAGMMDCKKALTEADGDFQKAIEILRKKGASVAAKRAEKAANEGMVATRIFNDDKSSIILEVNCETDFVANSDDFINFVGFLTDAIIDKKPADVDELMKVEFNGIKVEEEMSNIIGKIGEKVVISRFALDNVEVGKMVDYVHHGSKLGVIVKGENITDEVADNFMPMFKDIAMQVAAMKPSYLNREDVPKDVIEKEIEIYKEVAKKEGKPEQILEKIALGKLNKYYQENCLVEQAYIKDNSKTVTDLIKEFNEKNSCDIKLTLFRRFHLSDEQK